MPKRHGKINFEEQDAAVESRSHDDENYYEATETFDLDIHYDEPFYDNETGVNVRLQNETVSVRAGDVYCLKDGGIEINGDKFDFNSWNPRCPYQGSLSLDNMEEAIDCSESIDRDVYNDKVQVIKDGGANMSRYSAEELRYLSGSQEYDSREPAFDFDSMDDNNDFSYDM